MGSSKLVLFETNFATTYSPGHYLIFILLGFAGGLFGACLCKANFLWSTSFRKIYIIKNHPVLEVMLVVLITSLVQYPNPLTRVPGDNVWKNLLVDCRNPSKSWICQMEAKNNHSQYSGWLIHGMLVKLMLTIITFGCKVPSGIIIPALDAGGFFGRLSGQWFPATAPGIFAMVGGGAFLAGATRMTISIGVIMFEVGANFECISNSLIDLLAHW